MGISIIDISSDNGVIDFERVANAMMPDANDGNKRVIIRTSLGYGDKDKMCGTNANAAIAAGMTVSYYHFAYPDKKTGGTVESDSQAEANYFCDTVQALPAFEFLIIDLEQASPLTQIEYAQWLSSFLTCVKTRLSADVVIYTYADFLNRMLPDNHAFGANKLWIANYSAQTHPPLPKGWAGYFMWQYSETGVLDGIPGKVDCSVFNASTI